MQPALRKFANLARQKLSAPTPARSALREALELRAAVLADQSNTALQAKLERAAVSAGRGMMAAERFEDACQAWDALRIVENSRQMAERNLASAALKGARSAEEQKDFRSALRFWRYLIGVEPQSEAAHQGILRSTRALVVAGAKSSIRIAFSRNDANEDEQPAEETRSSIRGVARGLLGFVSGDAAKAGPKVQQLYRKLLADPTNGSLKAKFERAARLAGRSTLLAERYDDACSIWSSLRRIDPNNAQATRNLASAALKGARKAEEAGRFEEALQFWRYLKEAEPSSNVAAKGISRCTRFVI